ncbi:ATP-binding domain-containing protein [Hyphomicrobium sp. NDB2Meth4]|uniref:ATP-binding domain-containing protein n=1 Tax=Hyphomicrobium sp. NDB2Meth4 TaxID=1892846 RepID=UPI000B33F80F|nr:ATP-binding domain-containing protein [Hyphomicrobium sp. NDB2Meth4]
MPDQTWWCSESELDDDQKAVMELPPDGSFLVRGPPGSGKTNLLLMRASYLAMSHKNLIVVVFNRTLAEFLKAGAAKYKFPPDNVYTYVQLVRQLAQEAGYPFEKVTSFDEAREQSIAILTSLVEDRDEPMFDALLIDEAQDYRLEELRALRKLSSDIFLAADARQRIYKQDDADGSGLAKLVDEELDLRFHYRNALGICELADRIGDTFATQHKYVRITPGCRYPLDGPQEEIRIVQANLDEQTALIIERVKVQLRAFPDELIGVFAPYRADVEYIASALSQAGYGELLAAQGSEDGFIHIDPTRPIFVSSVHAAKGLEFRAVHFAAAETVKKARAEQKRVAFTAVTRAKTSLTVYHDGPLPGWFDKAVDPNRTASGHRHSWKDVFSDGE